MCVSVYSYIHTYVYTHSMVFNEQVQGRKDSGNSFYTQLFPFKISANIPLEHALYSYVYVHLHIVIFMFSVICDRRAWLNYFLISKN